MSDIVFLRAWVAVDLPRLYNPVTNLLGPPPQPRAAKHQVPPLLAVWCPLCVANFCWQAFKPRPPPAQHSI